MILVTAGRADDGCCAVAAADAADERFTLEFQVADGSWQRAAVVVPRRRFEEALPARPFRFEKGLRSFAGWWYFATTGAHVGFESGWSELLTELTQVRPLPLLPPGITDGDREAG